LILSVAPGRFLSYAPSKVPVNALSRLFCGIFLDRIHRQFEDIHLPQSIWQKDWVVHCKPAVQGTRTVLNYLARYIHRVAVTNSRILSAGNVKVTFRYRGAGTTGTKTMTVSAEEFIRRFLQHVLPAGVHKVRYYTMAFGVPRTAGTCLKCSRS